MKMQFAQEIKVLQTDNGGKYTSNEFEQYLLEHGIKHQKSRKNGLILEASISMMQRAGLPKLFWGPAVETAV